MKPADARRVWHDVRAARVWFADPVTLRCIASKCSDVCHALFVAYHSKPWPRAARRMFDRFCGEANSLEAYCDMVERERAVIA